MLTLFVKKKPKKKKQQQTPITHPRVLSSLQPGLRRFPSAVGFDGHFHARQNPDAEDLSHPNLQSPFVAKDPRIGRHGSLSGEVEVAPGLID